MPESKAKIVSYRRAEWIAANPPTLEWCLREAFGKKLKTIAERTVIMDSGRELKCLEFQSHASPSGVLLHLSLETPGEPASVVPHSTATDTSLDIGVVSAPSDAEYMDGDAFLFVTDNNVCLVATSFNESTIRLFLHLSLKEAKIRKDADKFELLKVADMDKMQMLHNDKIKEIDIRATTYQASASYSRRGGEAVNIMGSIAKYFRAFAGAENDVTNDAVRVTLSIKTDARSGKHLTLGQKRIEDFAVDLVENEQAGDDFIIYLESGNKITPKELSVKESVLITGHGKSVNKQEAWNALIAFYVNMQNKGYLEA